MANEHSSDNHAVRLYRLRDVAEEVIEAARAQDVWNDAEGAGSRWVTLALPAILLDKLAAEL